MIPMGSWLDVFVCLQSALVVEHLRDLHSQIQALCKRKANFTGRAVAEQAVNIQTPTEVTVRKIQEGLQDGGLTATQG